MKYIGPLVHNVMRTLNNNITSILLRNRLIILNVGKKYASTEQVPMSEFHETKDTHPYRNIHSCQSNFELAKHLKSSEIFHENGLIVLNRPYGIQKSTKTQQSGKSSFNTGGLDPYKLSIEGSLPHLCKLYDVDKLEVLSGTERWSSGLLLLSKTTSMTKHVTRCLRRAPSFGPHKEYLTLTIGKPSVEKTGQKRAGVILKQIDGIGKMPVIEEGYSKSSIKRHLVANIGVTHELSDYNSETNFSIVKMNVTSTRMHFLRLWMANNLSPILGDFLCGGRVHNIQGINVLLNCNVSSAYELKPLPPDIVKKLKLNAGLMSSLPCHLHYSRLYLYQFYKKNKQTKDLILYAPVPDYFKWTSQQFGLDVTKYENAPPISGYPYAAQ